MLNLIEELAPALLPESSADSGKVLAALLIYLVAFTLALLLFVRGFHSIAYITLFAVWAVLAAWLQKAGR
jgi:hypothetical protein